MKNKPVNISILLFLLVISGNFTQAQNSLIVKLNNNSQSGYLLMKLHCRFTQIFTIQKLDIITCSWPMMNFRYSTIPVFAARKPFLIHFGVLMEPILQQQVNVIQYSLTPTSLIIIPVGQAFHITAFSRIHILKIDLMLRKVACRPITMEILIAMPL